MRMKTGLSKAKDHKTRQPFEVAKVGGISIPFHVHTNIILLRDSQTGVILYDRLPDEKRKARVKFQSVIHTAACHQGTKRSRQKFSIGEWNLAAGRVEMIVGNVFVV